MTKERELLKKVFDCWNLGRGLIDLGEPMQEIREYFAAEQMKPLSEEEIEQSINYVGKNYLDWRQGFFFGIRFAEKHHGIGGGDDN